MPAGLVWKMARPTKYKPAYAKQVYKLALLGLTEAEMADVLDVSKATLTTWKQVHPEFLASITRGRAPADAEVAAKLFERACGYSHPETVISSYQGEITKTRVMRHYPPDTQAATRWLYNRQPARWRPQPDETQAPDAPTPVKVVVNVSDASIPEPG